MITIENKKFDRIRLNNNEMVRDITFDCCEFSDVRLSMPLTPNPSEYSLLKSCSFIDCIMHKSCSQTKAVMEEITFKKIKVKGLVGILGTLFKHVTFKGAIGKMMLSSDPYPGALFDRGEDADPEITDEEIALFKKFKNDYYNSVDWALDISAGEFEVFEIKSCIPAHLIKRDNETQAVVRYNKIKEGKWKLLSKIKESEVGMTLYDAEDDCVIVAPVRDKKRYPIFMEAIHILREEGIAEMK